MPSIDKVKKFKPRVMCWNDLTLENIDDILKFNSAEETQSYLADIFHLENHTEDLKAGILIDLYYYSLQFAIDGNFNREQISAFFSIVKSVHEMAVDTPFGNVDPVYEYCKELILCHSVKRPPFSIELYTVDQVKKITTYVVNTYFRHYKMYKYAFTPKVRLDLSIEYVGLPETPAPSEGEEENVEGTESEEAVTGEEQSVEAPEEEQIEETPAIKELKAMISSALTEQVQQLKTSVEEQIKAKDEEIGKKMGISLGTSSSSPKSPRSKGKKGK